LGKRISHGLGQMAALALLCLTVLSLIKEQAVAVDKAVAA